MRLIDADELFEHISHLSVTVTGLRSGKGILSEYAKHYRESVLWTVDEAPTVDAVPVVHGRWIDSVFCNVKQGKYPVVTCSECEIAFCDLISNHHYIYRYCPYCGAKMDGGNDDA